ncbi:hypothetical protein AMTR_s00114p00125160 [Amborella trichopoda]|uniref:Uncharacterized protein n=1 Tax=Amborella trichopoda TaxID=13333 RepID=W1NTT0_AMBTC|nr:hypothetical protein AMTR_s00114p00125160 [Amborella trichopoda]
MGIALLGRGFQLSLNGGPWIQPPSSMAFLSYYNTETTGSSSQHSDSNALFRSSLADAQYLFHSGPAPRSSEIRDYIFHTTLQRPEAPTCSFTQLLRPKSYFS